MAASPNKQTAAQIEVEMRDEWLTAFKRALNTRSTKWVTAVGTQKNISNNNGTYISLSDIIFDEKTAAKSTNKFIAELSVLIGKVIYDPAPAFTIAAPMLVVGVQISQPHNLILYSGPTSNSIAFFQGVNKLKTSTTLPRCVKTFITPFFRNLATDKGLKVIPTTDGFDVGLNPADTLRLTVASDTRARIVCKHPDRLLESHYHYDVGAAAGTLVISDLGELGALYLSPGFDRSKIFDVDYLLNYALSPGEGYQVVSRNMLRTRAQNISVQVKNTGQVSMQAAGAGAGTPSHINPRSLGLPLLYLNNDPEVKALFEEIYEVLACVGIEKTVEYTQDLVLIIFDTKQLFNLLSKINSDYWRRFMPSFGIPYFFEYKGKPMYTQTHLLLASTILSDSPVSLTAPIPTPREDPKASKSTTGIYKGNYLMPYKSKEELQQYEKYYSGGLLQLKNILQSDLDTAGKVELLEVIAALGSF